jgi:hypothetical protein
MYNGHYDDEIVSYFPESLWRLSYSEVLSAIFRISDDIGASLSKRK